MGSLNALRRASAVEGFKSLVPKSDYHEVILYRVALQDASAALTPPPTGRPDAYSVVAKRRRVTNWSSFPTLRKIGAGTGSNGGTAGPVWIVRPTFSTFMVPLVPTAIRYSSCHAKSFGLKKDEPLGECPVSTGFAVLIPIIDLAADELIVIEL